MKTEINNNLLHVDWQRRVCKSDPTPAFLLGARQEGKSSSRSFFFFPSVAGPRPRMLCTQRQRLMRGGKGRGERTHGGGWREHEHFWTRTLSIFIRPSHSFIPRTPPPPPPSSFAGLVADGVTHPIDTIRTRSAVLQSCCGVL